MSSLMAMFTWSGIPFSKGSSMKPRPPTERAPTGRNIRAETNVNGSTSSSSGGVSSSSARVSMTRGSSFPAPSHHSGGPIRNLGTSRTASERFKETWREREEESEYVDQGAARRSSGVKYSFTPGHYEAPTSRSRNDSSVTSSNLSLPAISNTSASVVGRDRDRDRDKDKDRDRDRDRDRESDRGGGKVTSSATPVANNKLCCDKCDGKHLTDDCPYYKKSRDSHPDAQKNFYKKLGGTSTLPGQHLRSAKVHRQPGDGSCLFHSMSFGLSQSGVSSTNASRLRAEICEFIRNNPQHKICETPLEDWIKWDSGGSCAAYASKMSRGSWGGGIEMAVVSHIKGCNVHVYERSGISGMVGLGGFRRISAFDHPDCPEMRKCIKVLYQGGVHYDALAA